MTSPPSHGEGVRPRGVLGLITSVVLVLVATFPWLGFGDHAHLDRVGWIPFVSPPIRPRDIAVNLLLCLPIGWFSGKLAGRWRGFLLAFGVALPLSLLAELIQLYSHTRFPSATDVVCNVAGAMLGVVLVRLYM